MARRTPSQLNMLLAVDKPVGCTSHDVVSRCRRALHERRVGHAGTLDPMASGVMVVGVGQATRLLGMLTLDTKSYVADISFGAETNTDDTEGEAIRTVAIAPEYQNKGYGTVMMNEFFNLFENAVFSLETKRNSISYKLYSKVGFKEVNGCLSMCKYDSK